MIFIDASHLVALAVRSDALHAAAMYWSRQVRESLLTTEYVLIEFVNRLSAPKHRGRAHQMFASMEGNKSVQILPASDVMYREGISLHAARPDKSWSLTDCISFNVMRGTGIQQALTYDQHFEQAGFCALLRTQIPPA